MKVSEVIWYGADNIYIFLWQAFEHNEMYFTVLFYRIVSKDENIEYYWDVGDKW